jgi:hypothetical protein
LCLVFFLFIHKETRCIKTTFLFKLSLKGWKGARRVLMVIHHIVGFFLLSLLLGMDINKRVNGFAEIELFDE